MMCKPDQTLQTVEQQKTRYHDGLGWTYSVVRVWLQSCHVSTMA